MLNVGNARQLFIDRRFITQAQGIELTMNAPRAREIVLQSEEPWEAYRVLFTSVLETDAGYRLYYEALCFDDNGRAFQSLCMAQSSDGRNWHRPALGLHAFQGSKDNNIVAPFLNGAPHYDPDDPLGHPYTMIGIVSGLLDPDGFKPPQEIKEPTKMQRVRDPVFGMVPNKPGLLVSTDGIHWQVAASPVLDFACDSWSNQIFYDHRIERHVGYLRGFPWRRTVHRYETDDPLRIPWAETPPNAPDMDGYGNVYLTDELPIVNDIDEQDQWAVGACDTRATSGDVQNPAVFKYPWAQEVYVAFPGLYRHYPGRLGNIPENAGSRHRYRFFNDGPNDIHLYVSRDGIRFARPSRWPYLELGIWGEWDGGCAFSGTGMLRSGNELWQYFTLERTTHGGIVPTDRNVGRIVRVQQRVDGFVSADAGHLGGEFTTPAVTFGGNRLQLNTDCSALGEAWVEIQNGEGYPIPGYTMAQCDPIDLNHTDIRVTWKNNPDVSRLQDTPIRLRFKMRLSKLYAFQFVNAKR